MIFKCPSKIIKYPLKCALCILLGDTVLFFNRKLPPNYTNIICHCDKNWDDLEILKEKIIKKEYKIV